MATAATVSVPAGKTVSTNVDLNVEDEVSVESALLVMKPMASISRLLVLAV